MATTSDIRKGLCIKYNHDIYKIIEFLHVKPGKGPAFVRTKLKSLTSGKVVDNTFSAGHKIDVVRVETNKFQYLYNDSTTYHFMNTDDYNQISIEEKFLDNPQLMKEGEIVETGSVDNVLRDPQHEYTQNLIASIPKITDITL